MFQPSAPASLAIITYSPVRATCTSPRLDELSQRRLDRQPAPAPTLLSHFLPATTSRARCCLVSVAMAPCGQNEASHAASCVLFPEGSWGEWGAVKARGLPLRGWPSPVQTHRLLADLSAPQCALAKVFFFFCAFSPLLSPFISNATFSTGTRLGFSLILCTSMDSSGSVVSTRAEQQSFHVRYR